MIKIWYNTGKPRKTGEGLGDHYCSIVLIEDEDEKIKGDKDTGAAERNNKMIDHDDNRDENSNNSDVGKSKGGEKRGAG